MAQRLDSAGLTFRQDYFGDPAGWAALVCLLKDIFGIDIGPLQQLGGPDPASMPFGWFDAEGELAAISQPLRCPSSSTAGSSMPPGCNRARCGHHGAAAASIATSR